jgi:hypothetical protein
MVILVLIDYVFLGKTMEIVGIYETNGNLKGYGLFISETIYRGTNFTPKVYFKFRDFISVSICFKV